MARLLNGGGAWKVSTHSRGVVWKLSMCSRRGMKIFTMTENINLPPLLHAIIVDKSLIDYCRSYNIDHVV